MHKAKAWLCWMLVILGSSSALWGCSESAPREAKSADVFVGGQMAERTVTTMEESDSDDAGDADDQTVADPMAMPVAAPPAAAKEKPAPATPQAHGKEQLLVYTAEYSLMVDQVTDAVDAVQKLAKDQGGYLVRRDDHSITVRVPAAKYRTVLAELGKLGDVVHQMESIEDVTDEFFDMKTRLENAQAMRTRLQELLAASKDVSQSLAIERELARITETIERMEGRLKRLRELIDFSTITASFTARSPESVGSRVVLPFPWLDHLGLGQLLRLD